MYYFGLTNYYLFVGFIGCEHLKLIFDFSVWVLKAHPDDGLKVSQELIPKEV